MKNKCLMVIIIIYNIIKIYAHKKLYYKNNFYIFNC